MKNTEKFTNLTFKNNLTDCLGFHQWGYYFSSFLVLLLFSSFWKNLEFFEKLNLS